jgi:hypothetical protein
LEAGRERRVVGKVSAPQPALVASVQRAIYDARFREPLTPNAAAIAAISAVRAAVYAEAPCAKRYGDFGPRCEVLPAEWLHNPDNNLGHRYTPPSWLTALLGEDSDHAE